MTPTVLLVEDDVIISLAQTHVIEGFGYEVIHAITGKQAIALANNNPNINLILMDIDLGHGINGIEAAKRILSQKNIPIVFLSSHIEKEYKDLVNSITGYGYVVKNSGDNVLKIAIEMALKLFNAHEESRMREQALLQSQKLLKEKNQHMEFLAELSLSIASQKYDDKLPQFLASQLKKVTNASFISIQLYDENKKVLKTNNILTDKNILNKLIDIYGNGLMELESPVSDEMYVEIIKNVVVKRNSLTEMSFGTIPSHIDKIYKKLSGVDRFYGLAFLIDGKLYGTAAFGIHKNDPNLSEELLASFAHICAVALKKKIVEEKYYHSENKYKNLVKNLNDVVFTIDSEGIVRFITESITPIIGYSVDELIGEKFMKFIYPEDLSTLMERFEATLRGEIEPTEFRLIKKNQELIWIRSSSKRAYLEEYNTFGLNGILMDITKEKFAQEKIQKLLNEKVLILKEVHHRIKNNMTMVSSLLSIQAKKFSAKEVVSAFENTNKRVQSMMLLYDRLYRENNFLDLSIKIYFESLIQNIRETLPANDRMEIKTEIMDEIISVKTLTNLGIIINELMTNIVKYAMKPTENILLTIDFTRANDTYILTIRHDGIGLSEDFSFDRAETFGLQLVQILVKQIDGEISIAQLDQNEVRICFPL